MWTQVPKKCPGVLRDPFPGFRYPGFPVAVLSIAAETVRCLLARWDRKSCQKAMSSGEDHPRIVVQALKSDCGPKGLGITHHGVSTTGHSTHDCKIYYVDTMKT